MILHPSLEKGARTKSFAFILSELSHNNLITRNQLMARRPNLPKPSVSKALEVLMKLGIVRKTEIEGKTLLTNKAPEGLSSPNFLFLNHSKRVRMSQEGHRAVRVHAEVVALTSGVTERRCGSILWKEESTAPKYRLGPAQRYDVLGGKTLSAPVFEVVKRRENDLVFRLVFNPPLLAGQVVKYGFYVWTRNHYAMSREDALRLFNDEWIREGLAVNDPTLNMTIKAQLPAGYVPQEADAEKDPIITVGGPNVSGSILTPLKPESDSLTLTLQEPATGHYFVCWKPPDTATALTKT